MDSCFLFASLFYEESHISKKFIFKNKAIWAIFIFRRHQEN